MKDFHENPAMASEKQDVIASTADTKKSQRKWIPLLFVFVLAAFVVVGIYSRFFTRGYYEIQKALDNEIKLISGTYSGETDFGIFSGYGTFNFGTGEQYIGDWSDYQFNGYGQLQHPDIGEYSGSFLAGCKHGMGTFTWTAGDSYSGECKYYVSTSQYYVTTWKNGICTKVTE